MERKDFITFIIQARVGSSRLPGKILLPFYNGKCILELLIEKLCHVEGTNIIVATSNDFSNNAIEDCVKKYNVPVFRGSENDVLQRFIDAATSYGVKKIIRICSDNPFLELDSIKQLVHIASSSDSDYVTLEALLRVKEETKEDFYHEHVTNYIYEHSNVFNISWIDVSNQLNKYPGIRLTVDTQQDFEDARNVYENLCNFNAFPTIHEVLEYLNTHQELYSLMQKQIIENSK